LDDRALVVNIHPGEVIKYGETKVIRGQGMPAQRHHDPGDLFVKITVTFPESIDPDLIPTLERVLPPRKPLEKFPKSITIDEVELLEMSERQRERAGDDGMDEDEDQPRVQCANQ